MYMYRFKKPYEIVHLLSNSLLNSNENYNLIIRIYILGTFYHIHTNALSWLCN